jgi:hypothetical protein
MMNYAVTRARSGEAVLPPPHPHTRWGLAEATMGKPMAFSPLPTTDEVDRLYR